MCWHHDVYCVQIVWAGQVKANCMFVVSKQQWLCLTSWLGPFRVEIDANKGVNGYTISNVLCDNLVCLVFFVYFCFIWYPLLSMFFFVKTYETWKSSQDEKKSRPSPLSLYAASLRERAQRRSDSLRKSRFILISTSICLFYRIWDRQVIVYVNFQRSCWCTLICLREEAIGKWWWRWY